MLKTIIGKLERKKIMAWTLMWLNWSVATTNAMLQLIYIYIYIYRHDCKNRDLDCRIA